MAGVMLFSSFIAFAGGQRAALTVVGYSWLRHDGCSLTGAKHQRLTGSFPAIGIA